jgi:hypothetical protein
MARISRAVDGRRTGSVVRDQDDLLKLPLSDHGIEVADLIGRGIGTARGFIRGAPSQKIKGNNLARRREMRNQTVVEVQVSGNPCIRTIVGSSPGYSRT